MRNDGGVDIVRGWLNPTFAQLRPRVRHKAPHGHAKQQCARHTMNVNNNAIIYDDEGPDFLEPPSTHVPQLMLAMTRVAQTKTIVMKTVLLIWSC